MQNKLRDASIDFAVKSVSVYLERGCMLELSLVKCTATWDLFKVCQILCS